MSIERGDNMSLDKLRKVIKESNNIVFFGGAGVSTESKIPDFRSASGLYNEKTKMNYSPEKILSHSFFMDHTKEFYDFYKSKMIYTDAKPNDAHLALAELEKMGKLKAVITQNIDGLHQSAGSKEVLELHGSVHRNYCTKCRKFFSLDYVIKSEEVPRCDDCGNIIKPDVVLYEESLDMGILYKSIDYIQKCQVLIVAGTSLTVYPAAGLISYFNGKDLILINKSKTPYEKLAGIVINDSVGKTLGSVI